MHNQALNKPEINCSVTVSNGVGMQLLSAMVIDPRFLRGAYYDGLNIHSTVGFQSIKWYTPLRVESTVQELYGAQ